MTDIGALFLAIALILFGIITDNGLTNIAKGLINLAEAILRNK